MNPTVASYRQRRAKEELSDSSPRCIPLAAVLLVCCSSRGHVNVTAGRIIEHDRAMLPTWTLFLDESGNAGPNYLDQEQPFHTEGGLLVPDASLVAVRTEIAASLGKFPAREFKAARLLKTKWAPLLAETLQSALRVEGVKLFFVTGERRYCLAGRIVETFLDPDTNPAAWFLPWWSVDARESAWEAVSWVDDAVLRQFAEAFRPLDPSALSHAAVAIAEDLDRIGFDHLAEACRSSVEHLEEIMRVARIWLGKGFDAGQVHALNVPMCMHAAKLADRMLDTKAVPAAFRLVHDRVDWFSDVFVHASNTLGGETGTPLELPRQSGPSVRMGLRRLDSCAVADSKTELCLQLADVVASTVSRVLRGCIKGDLKLSSGEAAIAKLTIPLLYEPLNLHGAILASNAAKERIDEQLTKKEIVHSDF